ncbi:MAG: low-specificity L-threonine aldolase [Thermacetogeniaceae bacterium]|jgi:threonine aldolase|nr:low-specificity L-threonine aldolase [Thermoanaerobacterales bacterium]NLN21777.1 low-specificity L-threonine aldolase [Syntrophomonadaceae bacterium]
MIDLRSDTITKPTQEMREAMANAIVGDDVFGEDPTVNKLEETAAELVGKESALFVASGTMGNQVAVLTHTERGNEVIVDTAAHIAKYEVGAPAMFAGVQLRLVDNLLLGNTIDKIKNAYREENIHFPVTRLVCLENTFNSGGGTIMPPEKMREAYQLARNLNLKLHLDGARIFNAAVACQCDVKEFTKCCDSVMFCLSKGLGAPVGSILAGDQEFIKKARKYRKAMGGGMRQAGILAAAGLVALKSIDRLAEDHSNARFLAEGLSQIKGIKVDLERVQTNMVYVEVDNAAAFVSELEKNGVKAIAVSSNAVRFVTSREVTREDIEKVIQIASRIAVTNK